MIATTTDFGAALTAAFLGQYVAQLTGQTYTITSPIVIHVSGGVTVSEGFGAARAFRHRPFQGLDAGGAVEKG